MFSWNHINKPVNAHTTGIFNILLSVFLHATLSKFLITSILFPYRLFLPLHGWHLHVILGLLFYVES